MRITRKRAAVALVAVAALGLQLPAAPTSDGGDGGGSSEPKLDNKALDKVVNPSDEKGGTLKMAPRRRLGRQLRPGRHLLRLLLEPRPQLLRARW